MRRPKHKHIVSDDDYRYLLTSHGDASNIEISATEHSAGTLIVEVERHEGDVVLIVPRGLRIEYKD